LKRGEQLNLGEVKDLKKGAPGIKGVEVKSVAFDVEPTGKAGKPILEELKSEVVAWLESDIKFQTLKLSFTDPFRATFTNGGEKAAASLILDNFEGSGFAAFELQSVVPFYRGVETTRVRAIASPGQTRLEVSTFMESKDPTRAVHEIPRLADSLVSALSTSSLIRLSVDGTPVNSSPFKVTKDNVKKSPLAFSHKPHVMPIIGFPDDEVGNQQAIRLAQEAAGLAEVLVVAKELFGKSGRSFFVYWRDGTTSVEWHQTIASKYRVSRQIYLRGLRNEAFQTAWRHAQNSKRFSGTHANKSGQDQSVDHALVADLRSQVAEWKEKALRITAERDSFIQEFDATQKRWREWIEEGQKHNAKLFALSTREAVNPEEFRLSPFLVGDGSTLEEMFASLEAATLGAVVFTDRVTRSWQEAQKRGYGKAEPMERALGALCRLAIGYRFSKAELGGSRKQFFQKFGLELIEADNKLPNKKFTWGGRTFNQEHHIRADQKNATFNTLGRIHFDFDVEQLRIIVNHVGGKQYENDK
jgi:hypothetical protein